MTERPSLATNECPECGAVQISGRTDCWLCFRRMSDVIIAELVVLPKEITPDATTFNLASIFLIITLIAVGLGLAASEPGFAVIFVIIVVPALIATVRLVQKRTIHGEQIGVLQKIATFMVSSLAVVGLLLVIAVAAVVALFAVCLFLVGF